MGQEITSLVQTYTQQCAADTVLANNSMFSTMVQTLALAQCVSYPWPEDYGPTALENGLDPYDFIIVGAGPAGSLMANRLSENPNWRVLLLEAGGDPPIESMVPTLFSFLQGTKYDWQYFCEPSTKAALSLVNNTYWPRGKMLGGTSALNAMLYVRGNRRDYDTWAAMGNDGWDYDTVLPIFKEFEDNQDPIIASDTVNHGIGGELKVGRFFGEPILQAMFTGGLQEMGQPIVEDINIGQPQLEFTELEGTVYNGERCSGANAYLTPVKDRPNLHVIKNAFATRLTYSAPGTVNGVNFILNGQNLTAQSTKEVISSAGVINSPVLLMNSGIGPEQQLQDKQIPVVKNLSVGRNLQDHPQIPIYLKVKSNFLPLLDAEVAAAEALYIASRTGPIAGIRLTNFGGFVSTINDTNYPDIQYHLLNFYPRDQNLPFATTIYGFEQSVSDSILAANKNFAIVHVFVTLLTPGPLSKGNLTLRSNNPTDHPILQSGYLEDPSDIATIIRGIRFVQKLVKTSVFKLNGVDIVKLNISGCASLTYDTDTYWECYARHLTLNMWHEVGTCKMGPATDPDAVVDNQLRVHGVNGLRVVDASIMPKIVSGNTNVPTQMIAENAAGFVKAAWQ